MKSVHRIYTLLAGLCLVAFTACNKGADDFLYKGDNVPVSIKGYNGSSEELEVTIDTFKVPALASANALIDLNAAYTFWGDQQTARMVITEKATAKKVLEKELKKGDGPTTLRFLYMNGQVSDMPEKPEAEAGKLKISYMFRPTLTNYTAPVDIALVKYYFTPKVFEEVARIKNVKPYEFSEPFTLPTFSTAVQPYNGVNTSVLFRAYIYKAGTNEFYTEGSAYTWHATSSAVPTPVASTASSKLYIFSESEAAGSIRFTKNLEL